jgi:hypothetical protein
VRERPLAPVEHGVGELMEGPLAAVTPVAFAAGSVVLMPPWINLVALAPGTLQGTIFPPPRRDGGLTLVGVAKLVDVREHRQG